MQVVALGFGLHQVVATHKSGRQPDAAAALDHQHGEIAARTHPLLEGAAGRPGGADVALGVFDPVLDDFDQLLQEGEAALIAAHQGLMGKIHGGSVVLTVGQPALQVAHQIGVEATNRDREPGHLFIEAGLHQGCREGFHLGVGNHLEQLGFTEEAGPGDGVTAGGDQIKQLAWIGAYLQAVVDQPLEAMGPGPQAKAVGPQQDRRAVAIGEGVGYAGTHGSSALDGAVVVAMLAAMLAATK